MVIAMHKIRIEYAHKSWGKKGQNKQKMDGRELHNEENEKKEKAIMWVMACCSYWPTITCECIWIGAMASILLFHSNVWCLHNANDTCSMVMEVEIRMDHAHWFIDAHWFSLAHTLIQTCIHIEDIANQKWRGNAKWHIILLWHFFWGGGERRVKDPAPKMK